MLDGPLTAAEDKLLKEHLDFYLSLVWGDRKPTTPAQVHFIQVAKGDAAPETIHEIAFAKWEQLQKKEEADARLAREKWSQERELKAYRLMEANSGQVEREQPAAFAQPNQKSVPLGGWFGNLTAPTEGDAFPTCPVCSGDGGYENQCYKCGGSGWVSPK